MHDRRAYTDVYAVVRDYPIGVRVELRLGHPALRNPQSGKCLDAINGAPLFDGQKMQLWTSRNQTGAQRWTF